jgi:hypothetical protein
MAQNLNFEKTFGLWAATGRRTHALNFKFYRGVSERETLQPAHY